MLTKNKLSIKENIVSIDTFTYSDVKIIAKKCCYQGFFTIDEYQLQHKLYQGGHSKILTREIFERGDAVVLMPYDVKNDNVVFVTQFRVGALRLANENKTQSPWLLEFIAGMFNDNENPIEVAIREAKEEANITISAYLLILGNMN
jgi:ADP-ribose pyrophosphatase